MIIDIENHLSMPWEKASKHESNKVCERYWDKDGEVHIKMSPDAANVELFLKFMDDAGIDMAVLSSQLRGLESNMKWHNYCAKLVKEHPKRLAGFASIPPLGGKPALDELERAVKVCGMKGVHIFTKNEGEKLDSHKMWPFYEKVSELNVPIDIHITAVPPGFDSLHASYALFYVAAREFDMAAATMRVCFGGVLEDFPDLKLVMNHFGGGVSSIIERFDAYTAFASEPGWPGFYSGKPRINKSFRHYFDKLYFNMAGREGGMDAVQCALTNISPKKLMFGTDWPLNYDYHPELVREYINNIGKLSLQKEAIEGMLGGNAAKLLGIDNSWMIA